MKRFITVCVATLLLAAPVFAQGLKVEDTKGDPVNRVITVTSPGVFEAQVVQGTGGGISRFYNLAVDPGKKTNLAFEGRGLLEIGWHGGGFKGPDAKDCCEKHILSKQPKKEGESCYNGCGDWPSSAHRDYFVRNHNRPGCPNTLGTLEIVEQSPARVRIRAEAPFMWWGKHVHTHLIATATYTFNPTGGIVAQVRVRNTGEPKRAFHWSSEFGPHIMVPGSDKNPEADPGFTWSTPTQEKGEKFGDPVEALILATSEKAKTAFLLTIPPEEEKTFTRMMRHNGRSVRSICRAARISSSLGRPSRLMNPPGNLHAA